jgi:hypothetical protein
MERGKGKYHMIPSFHMISFLKKSNLKVSANFFKKMRSSRRCVSKSLELLEPNLKYKETKKHK